MVSANQAQKRRLLEQPAGILLITPESLEAIFVNHGSRVPTLLGHLAYVIVDELHAFIGSERGRQLQSLLHRLDLTARRRVPSAWAERPPWAIWRLPWAFSVPAMSIPAT